MTARLRAALAAMTQPLPWKKRPQEPANATLGHVSLWKLIDANGFCVCGDLAEPDADAILLALDHARRAAKVRR